jgi:hypothetical protein
MLRMAPMDDEGRALSRLVWAGRVLTWIRAPIAILLLGLWAAPLRQKDAAP